MRGRESRGHYGLWLYISDGNLPVVAPTPVLWWLDLVHEGAAVLNRGRPRRGTPRIFLCLHLVQNFL